MKQDNERRIAMKTSEVLHRAADLIEERGWAKAGFDPWGSFDSTSPICLEGGMVAALGIQVKMPGAPQCMGPGYDEFLACPAYLAVRSYLADRMVFLGVKELWQWNDRYASDAAEVIEVLRAAALIEAAKESELAEVTR